MAVRDQIFSKRAARLAKGEQPDVYRYDVLPQPFRVQVARIWTRAIKLHTVWLGIEHTVSEEHGLFGLSNHRTAEERCWHYLLHEEDTAKVLDLTEVSFADALKELQRFYTELQRVEAGIEDLNLRFREHAIGYQFIGGQIVRVDSQYLHAQATKPALGLLNDAGFSGAEEEFRRAHEHYRSGDYKEAINNAHKAFESTLKAICTQRSWPHDPRGTASALLKVVFDQGLVPEYLNSAFSGIRSVLESAVPTTRNRSSAHGQGPNPIEVPEYLAAYVLHSAASAVVFLVKAHRAPNTIALSRAQGPSTT